MLHGSGFNAGAADNWLATRALRTTPLRCVTFGDSQANTNDCVSPATQDASKASASVWNSGTVTLRQHGRKWGLPWFYPQAYLVGNCGVSGNTTTQMLARDVASSSTTRRAIADVINLNPDVVIYRGGSINDFSAVTNAGQVATALATAQANVIEIMTRFASANLPVLVEGIYGYSSTTMYAGDPDQIRSAIVQQNAFLRALCAARTDGLWRYVDPVGVVSDADGNFLSSAMYINAASNDNGVHLSGLGQYLMAQVEAQILTSMFGRSTNERYRGTNLFNGNPLLVNASSVSYGTVYDGLTVTGSSATIANAKIETIGGKRFQTAEVTLTGAGYGTVNIPFNPTATGLNVSSGDIYGFECDTFLSGLNGSTPTLSTENQRLTINNSVGSGSVVVDTAMIDGSSYGFQIPAGQQFIRHMVFPPLVFGDNAANLLTSSTWFFRVTPSDGAGMAFKLGVANPRIVKLNQAVTTI